MSPVLAESHQLSIHFRIECEILLITFEVLHGLLTLHISVLLTLVCTKTLQIGGPGIICFYC